MKLRVAERILGRIVPGHRYSRATFLAAWTRVQRKRNLEKRSRCFVCGHRLPRQGRKRLHCANRSCFLASLWTAPAPHDELFRVGLPQIVLEGGCVAVMFCIITEPLTLFEVEVYGTGNTVTLAITVERHGELTSIDYRPHAPVDLAPGDRVQVTVTGAPGDRVTACLVTRKPRKLHRGAP